MIIYLHGFRSSPTSFKSRLLQQAMQSAGRADEFLCPALPASPTEAIQLLQNLCARYPATQLSLVGSSLGGFYATWLAEQLGCRAVLLNPAVQPPRDLSRYIGVTTEYHSNARFEFTAGHAQQLHLYTISQISRPERYFLLAATGDEVLDWREMVAHYPGARQRIIQGSDHGLSDFAAELEAVLAFCDAA